MSTTNRQYKLAQRPVGMVKREDFEFAEGAVPEPGDGQILVKIEFISLDPAMRGWMNDAKSYLPPVGIGEVMRAGGAGKVIKSNNPAFNVGDSVVGVFGVQDYALSDGKGVTRVDTRAAPLSAFLGVLGMPGMTAYFGLFTVGEYKEGDTVVVSGAAGAVGSVVGQLAKIKGSRVVGIAGGADKCRHVVEDLGFDACIDYKSENLKTALKEHLPKGVDLYFDNVGGEILDTVLTQIRMHARIVICGAISQYNNTQAVKGPSNYLSLLVNRGTMRGMVVFDYAKRYGEAVQEMAQWIAAGKLKYREDVVDDLATFPDTLLKLFKGENLGKLLIRNG
jgi:NADPH-dependent curcumin reductase CurA